jgi:hypothetical protein
MNDQFPSFPIVLNVFMVLHYFFINISYFSFTSTLPVIRECPVYSHHS